MTGIDGDVPEFFCERCGVVAGGALPAGGFCLSCRLHVCTRCYGDAPPRCAKCARLPLRPLGAARQALNVLRDAPKEHALLTADRGMRGQTDRHRQVDRHLLALKVDTARRAAHDALAGMDGDESPRADAVRHDLTAALEAVDALLPPAPDARTATAPHEPYHRRVAAGIAGAVVAMAVGAALFIGGDMPAADVPGPTGGVAAGRSSPSPTAPAVAPGDRVRVVATFDDLVMEAPLGDAWAASGGVRTAGVAAFPSPFDRSIRLRASAAPEHMCRLIDDLPDAGLEVAVDVLLDAAPSGARLVELRDGDRTIAGVALEALGRVTFTVAGVTVMSDAPWEPERWYRVAIHFGSGDGSELRFVVTDLEEDAVEAQHDAPGVTDTVGVDRLCFALPANAEGDLYVDDLAIQ